MISASPLHMRGSQIFRKIKAPTGKSPILFVRSIYLAEARRLLESTELSVSEIACDTGFSSPQFFPDAFRRSSECGLQSYVADFGAGNRQGQMGA